MRQVIERNQSVGLATTIRQFQLANGLVILTRQPQDHVRRQLAQIISRIGQSKKIIRVSVNLHYHSTQLKRLVSTPLRSFTWLLILSNKARSSLPAPASSIRACNNCP